MGLMHLRRPGMAAWPSIKTVIAGLSLLLLSKEAAKHEEVSEATPHCSPGPIVLDVRGRGRNIGRS